MRSAVVGENRHMAKAKIKALGAQDLYRSCDLSQFDFETTAELEPLERPLGQDRALEAIEFGVDIDQPGFNLFVVGDPGIGKQELVRQILSRHACNGDSPFDWCYVNNFDNPQTVSYTHLTLPTKA